MARIIFGAILVSAGAVLALFCIVGAFEPFIRPNEPLIQQVGGAIPFMLFSAACFGGPAALTITTAVLLIRSGLRTEKGKAFMLPPAEPVDQSISLRKIAWRWQDVFLGVAVLLVWDIPVYVVPRWLASLPPFVTLIAYVLPPQLWALFYPLWVARRNGSGSPLRYRGLKAVAKEAMFAVPVLICFWVILALAIVAWSLLLGEDTLPLGASERLGQSTHVTAVLAFLVMSFTLAPLAEEVFFRGFLHNALSRYFPTFVAAVAQALVFGLMHMTSRPSYPTYGFSYAVLTFILGLLLALVYEWRKTLVTPIFVHALQNLTVAVFVVVAMVRFGAAPTIGVRGVPHEQGYLLTEVVAGSPAEKSDVRPGDIITSLDGQRVTSIEDLTRLLRSRKVGQSVRLELNREGEILVKDAIPRPRREVYSQSP